VKCFKCGGFGQYSNDCKKGESCYKCGKVGHKSFKCKKEIVCYNCGEAGHISTKCTKPKKAAGKVFALNAEEVEQPNNLIRGKCPVNFGNIDFELDLVCLPLKHMNVIFGMD